MATKSMETDMELLTQFYLNPGTKDGTLALAKLLVGIVKKANLQEQQIKALGDRIVALEARGFFTLPEPETKALPKAAPPAAAAAPAAASGVASGVPAAAKAADSG